MRRLTLLAILLGVGLVVNGVVALVIAATVNVLSQPAYGGMAHFGDVHWTVQTSSYVPTEWVVSTERRGENPGTTQITPAESVPRWLAIDEPSEETFANLEYRRQRYQASGWPMLCTWCRLDSFELAIDGTRQGSGVQGGIALPLPDWTGRGSSTQPRVLPLCPIWLGLFVNTVFYAALAAAALVLLGFLRSTHRFRRGRCPRCAYDLRWDYSRGCSECGWRGGRDAVPVPPENPIRGRDRT